MLNGSAVARTNARGLYWTAPQQLAHATVNGAPARAGDLFASGTVSGNLEGRQSLGGQCDSSTRFVTGLARPGPQVVGRRASRRA